MKIQKYQNNNVKYSFHRQSIPLEKYNNICIISKLAFSILFFFILFLLITRIRSKNNNKKLKTILPKKYKEIEQKYKIFSDKLRTILDKEEFFENEIMSKHTTFQLGGPAKFFIKPKSINKIIKIILLCKEYSIEYFILGNGSNLLVSDFGYDGLIININEDNFSDLKIKQVDKINYKVTVGGGMLMTNLAKRLCLFSLSGLEDIIDIPGTIGGGIIMNANSGSKKGLIYESLDKVKVITPEGKIKKLLKKDCKLGIRGSFLKDNKYMVIEATFNLRKGDKMIIQQKMSNLTSLRYLRQPRYFPNAGCFFVWYKQKFGSLYAKYKESNLVGYKVGEAMICNYNIAFIINLGNAKSSDVYEVAKFVEKIMKSKYGINIKREVIILGAFS